MNILVMAVMMVAMVVFLHRRGSHGHHAARTEHVETPADRPTGQPSTRTAGEPQAEMDQGKATPALPPMDSPTGR